MEELSPSDSFAKKAEDFIFRFRYPILITLLGLILIGVGAFFVKTKTSSDSQGIEVINSPTEPQNNEIFVEIGGAVVNPGVYIFSESARVEELLVKAGGFSDNADLDFIEKNLNRAAKLLDGQKFYIPTQEEVVANSDNHSDVLSASSGMVYQSGSLTVSDQNSSLTNINTASLSDLDKLPGIGPVYGQKIIDQRPYSNIDELASRKIVPKSTFEKIKSLISVN